MRPDPSAQVSLHRDIQKQIQQDLHCIVQILLLYLALACEVSIIYNILQDVWFVSAE